MVGYPNKRKSLSIPTQSVNDRHRCRGMILENDLNVSNEYYRVSGRALIYKKPTPIRVAKVNYPSRAAAKIVEAYYQTPSTTDYNGVYKGKPIDFEAKETKSKTSFPFSSIHLHQIEHLKQVAFHRGIGFFIIRFSAYDEVYLIDADIIIQQYENGIKKSISYKDIKALGTLINQGTNPRLRYLDVVDSVYFSKER